MSDGIKWYHIGPEAVLGLKRLSDELGMPDDTVTFLNNCLTDIDEIIETLGKDSNSEHYEHEIAFRKSMENIKTFFDESIQVIEKLSEKCEDILRNLDDVLANEGYSEFFLYEYQNGVDI